MTSYEPFGGEIARTQAESMPWWPTPPQAREGAPNVVVIVLDDLGFAHLGCYGSDIETPNIDRLAAGGLQLTDFHVTPLCSPTRAALLTGRNHHSVGMRAVSNFSTGYPNMRGRISNHAATMAEVLRAEGYTTFGLGKWHLCPMEETSAAGPYDQWPLQRGFDRFYGFLDGEADQFTPELVHDNHAVLPPMTPEEGYHLSEDLVDKAIGFLHDTVSIRPDRPFFTYLAFGATHAPHQAPAEYLEKYRGRFDEGWDVARERWFARQQELGVIPPGTELAPRNPGVEAWDELPENHRKLAGRLQEAFAAFLDHTDAQIGRLLEALEALGRLDDTVIVLLSDNGASQEGGPFGVLHEMKFFNFILEEPDEAIARLDDIGGPSIEDPGGRRDQFHYVTDIAPTIYEICGVTPPETHHGFDQMPVVGTSMRYLFGAGAAAEPSRKTVQYFEMMGHRAIHADGWKAVTRHQAGTPFDEDRWEMYHVAEDRSELHDLAEAQPEKLAELVDLWWQEAEANGVFPLDDRTVQLFGARFRDNAPHRADRHYRYRPPITPLPAQAGPQVGGRSWDLEAVIDRPAGVGGVLYATGNENSGMSLFVEGDRLVFDYNCFGDHQVVESEVEVPTGSSVVGVRFRREDTSGDATLVIDGADCGTVVLPFVMRMISSVGASIGYDHGSPVSHRYSGENPFAGTLHQVDVQLLSPGEAAAERAATEARAGLSRQ